MTMTMEQWQKAVDAWVEKRIKGRAGYTGPAWVCTHRSKKD